MSRLSTRKRWSDDGYLAFNPCISDAVLRKVAKIHIKGYLPRGQAGERAQTHHPVSQSVSCQTRTLRESCNWYSREVFFGVFQLIPRLPNKRALSIISLFAPKKQVRDSKTK